MNYLRKPFRYRYTSLTATLLLLHAGIFFLTLKLPFLYRFFGLTPFLTVRAHMYWQVFTYQFLHGDFWHLFSNMLGLVVFGTAVEKKIGSSEFLLFYFLTATLCGITSCFTYTMIGFDRVTLIGSSGAVFAVLYLFAVIFPLSIILVFGIIPVPAPLLIIVYVCMESYDMLFSYDSVAHSVHLSGLLFAWLYIRIRFNIRPMKVWNIVR